MFYLEEAEDFNSEFKAKATRNLSSQYGQNHNIRNGIHGRQQQAIEAPQSSSKNIRRSTSGNIIYKKFHIFFNINANKI